jgi:hypothetical protein
MIPTRDEHPRVSTTAIAVAEEAGSETDGESQVVEGHDMIRHWHKKCHLLRRVCTVLRTRQILIIRQPSTARYGESAPRTTPARGSGGGSWLTPLRVP